jgi:hypothetical protein
VEGGCGMRHEIIRIGVRYGRQEARMNGKKEEGM